MTTLTQGLRHIWPEGRPLIGMVHLPPLPGAPGWDGSMDRVEQRAGTDAEALEQAGFDGVIVENYQDAPFHPRRVPAETVAALTVAVAAVRRAVDLPVGVNVLRNDAASALGIAAATGAGFVRVNVHTGSMWTDQGLLEGRAHETLRLRQGLGLPIAIMADVHVKHATPPAGSELAGAAADAWHRGRADALIVSGRGTGSATSLDALRTVREAVPGATLLVGSGASAETVQDLLGVAHGVIVGSAIMNDGEPGTGIDPGRALAFIEAARG